MDVVLDNTGGKFGPFARQLFIGEFRLSENRVFLEKVGGEYQGACFGFAVVSIQLSCEWISTLTDKCMLA